MARFRIIINGEEQSEIFDDEDAAEEYAQYLCSCTRVGAKTLNLSNPGDYDYDEDLDEEYEIVEC